VKNVRRKYEQQMNSKKFQDVNLAEQARHAGLAEFNLALDDEDENEREFLDEKLREYEGELPQQDDGNHLKGWGAWTGLGVRERKPPSQEELLRKKIKEIREV
jgi:U3 small nucleolar RNA-associated protein 14